MNENNIIIIKNRETRGGPVGRGSVLQTGRSRVRFPMVHSHNPSHYVPGFYSVSKINEHHKYFLQDKGGRCVWLTTLPLSRADYPQIGQPQPPGTIRSCTRIVLLS